MKSITTKGQVISKYAMAALEAMLPATDFLRIHRSFIIATGKLTAYTNSYVQLGSIELPIGRMYQYEVLRRLQPLL